MTAVFKPLKEKSYFPGVCVWGKRVAPIVALLGQLVEQRPAGVGDVQHARHLVEGFTGGVIQRLPSRRYSP